MRAQHGNVDFEAVIANATAAGIDLQEIAIRYEGLSSKELAELREGQEVTHVLSGGVVLAKFPLVGTPRFQNKATSVFSLGA